MSILMDSDLFSKSKLVIEQIYNSRNMFIKNDLQHIVSQSDLQSDSSFYIKYLCQYLDRLPENFNPKEKLWLSNGRGEMVTDYDQKRSLNMMVFSTTWSHPSSLLLHYLKAEQQDFSRLDFYLVDIGLDEKEEWWESKLIKADEKNWDQLYVPRDLRAVVMFRYKITGFPVIVFTDQTGREIYRIEKYDEHMIEHSRNFIEQFFDNSKLGNH